MEHPDADEVFYIGAAFRPPGPHYSDSNKKEEKAAKTSKIQACDRGDQGEGHNCEWEAEKEEAQQHQLLNNNQIASSKWAAPHCDRLMGGTHPVSIFILTYFHCKILNVGVEVKKKKKV